MTFPPLEALPFLEGVAQSYLQIGLFHPLIVRLSFRQKVLIGHKVGIVPRVEDREIRRASPCHQGAHSV